MNINQLAKRWVMANKPSIPISEYYCETRDIFKARHDRMLAYFIDQGIAEDVAYMILAIVGEIGNNSFDHNLGGWPDVMGILFAYEIQNGQIKVVLADRGRGVLKTLQRVRPSISDSSEALRVAFTEKLSGRAPEARGNGLKFVREGIKTQKMHLTFLSGNAQADLNETTEIKLVNESINGCLATITL